MVIKIFWWPVVSEYKYSDHHWPAGVDHGADVAARLEQRHRLGVGHLSMFRLGRDPQALQVGVERGREVTCPAAPRLPHVVRQTRVARHQVEVGGFRRQVFESDDVEETAGRRRPLPTQHQLELVDLLLRARVAAGEEGDEAAGRLDERHVVAERRRLRDDAHVRAAPLQEARQQAGVPLVAQRVAEEHAAAPAAAAGRPHSSSGGGRRGR